MDLEAIWHDAWPWIWPTLALIAWTVLFVLGGRRWAVWVEARVKGRAIDDRLLERMVRLFLVGMLLLGGYLWALTVPLRNSAHSFIAAELGPWVWGTALFVSFLVLGIYLVRRGLAWISERVSTTESRLDDALVAALTRPLVVTIVLLGLNLWASIVPIPAGLQKYVSAGSEATIVVLIVLFADGVAQGWMISREDKSKVMRTSGAVLRTSVRVAIYTIGLLMALSSMGLDVTPILASLGVSSIAIGLALQSTLEDFVAGLLLAADQPVTVGDFVELEDGLSGVVLSIGWRTTRILTRDDMHIITPNSKLAKSTVINRSRPRVQGKFIVAVGVTYGSDLRHVTEVTQKLALEIQASDPRAVARYHPKVVFSQFGPSSVDFSVWLSAKSWEEQFGMRSAFITALHARYAERGISIAFPTRTLDVPPGTLVHIADVEDEPPPLRGSATGRST